MRHIKNLLAPKFLLFLALSFTLFITVGSLISTSSIPKINFTVSDKLIHAVSYFILVFLWTFYLTFQYKKRSFKNLVLITAGLAFVYGIIIEVIQGTLVESRTADVFDALANGLGIVTAVLALIFFQSDLIKLKSKN